MAARYQFRLPAVRETQCWEFLADVRALAHAQGKRKVAWAIPINVCADLPRSGYTLAWDETETCFEIRQ